ncbi:MAG: protease modulator HflK, partial [Gammaproteobacteria bacterium]|nr:protease modulator HflK [Gammaproteobacteria bacterium]
RLKNDAEAYANDIIPKARGNAARQMEEANGYKARVVAQAEGESKRFTELLNEYKKAPQVTRDRLYLDTIELVLGNTTKVLVDVEGGNNLLYLPLDKLMGQRNTAPATPITLPNVQQFVPPPQPQVQKKVERRLRDTLRDRGAR